MALENRRESGGVDGDGQRHSNGTLHTISQLAANVTRELRGPLNELKTKVYQLVRAENLTPQQLGQELGSINRLIDVANAALVSLTDAAQLRPPELRPLDLPKLMLEVFDGLQMPRNIVGSLNVSRALPVLLADESQLEVVLRSLIQNAIEAMPDGGQLAINATEQNGEAIIIVNDTGKGISPIDIDHIMTPLYTTNLQQFGLGLAVAKAILEMHNGTLSVRSELNIGSEFVVVLPIRRE